MLKTPAPAVAASTVKPRHILCFLGGDGTAYARLSKGLAAAIAAHAPDFEIDEEYSEAAPDPRMEASFEVCWDRLAPSGWTAADRSAVAGHQSVRYVLGPPMTPDTAVATSARAMRIVAAGIEAGAVAVKGESAGVAHGLARWRRLIASADEAARADDVHALRRHCRLAFAKRPLADGEYLQSVGFHLVGLPEVYVRDAFQTQLDGVAVMDAIADELSRDPLATVLERHEARHTFESLYDEAEFKFNPYGCVIVG